MNFLTDGVGRFEETLHKIMVVIRKKVFGTVFKEGTIILNYCFLIELGLNALSFSAGCA